MSRIGLIDTLRAAVHGLRACLWPMAAFDLAFWLPAVAVLAPAVSWLVALVVSPSGRIVLGNDQILGFLASPSGVAWMLLSGGTAGTILCARAAGFMLLAGDHWSGRRPSAAAALGRIGRHAPRLTALAVRQVGAHLLVTAPFLVALAVGYRVLLSGYEINYLVHETPPVWWLAVGIGGALVVMALLVNLGLYIRWALALPVLVFEGVGASTALRSSRDLLRGRMARFAVAIGSTAAISVALLVLTVEIVHLGGRAVFAAFPTSPRAAVPLVILLLTVEGLVVVLTTFVGVALDSLVRVWQWRELAGRRFEAIKLEAGVDITRERHLKIWVSAAIAVVVVVGTVMAVVAAGRLDVEDRVEITAHRGSSAAAPENTLSAIRQAIQDSAQWAEIDVRQTADGEVVVFHDEDFMRFARDERKIWDLSFDDVRTFDVGGWFAPEFEGERVPTLGEAIAVARGRIRLNIELKFQRAERSLAERVVDILHGREFVDQALVTSLSLRGLAHVREIDPSIRIGAILYRTLGRPARMDADALAVHTRLATRNVIVAAQRTGKRVHVWTVNDEGRMSRYIDLGVNNILTDHPTVLADLLAERALLSDEERLLLKLRTVLGW
jgi:glycerophosphoryl diester phosphodiesterase